MVMTIGGAGSMHRVNMAVWVHGSCYPGGWKFLSQKCALLFLGTRLSNSSTEACMSMYISCTPACFVLNNVQKWLMLTHSIINPHQRCRGSDSPFARIYCFCTAGSRNGLEGLAAMGTRTQKEVDPKKNILLLQKHLLRTSNRIRKRSWISWNR